MNPEELQTCRNLRAMLQDENGEVAEYWGKMLAHIDAQAGQIAALKDTMVEERARRICHTKKDTVGHWPRYEDVLAQEARKQLAEDEKLKAAGVTFSDKDNC